jgi:hypothetical protein
MGLNFTDGEAQYIEGRNYEVWSTENECLLFTPGTEVACDASTPPTGLYASDITATSAILNWDIVPDADKYVVALWKTSDITSARRRGVNDNNLEISDALEPGTEYGFRVRHVCYDEGDISPFSEPYYFTTSLRLGQLDKNISVFPNPSHGNVTLQMKGYENMHAEIILLNSLGQQVYKNRVFNSDEIVNLPLELYVTKGLYEAQVITGNDMQVLQIVIE